LVRNAGAAKGKALGFNGIFGSLGAASAGITAGLLIDVFSWRAAFALPGIISVVIGIVLWLFVLRGRVADAPAGAASRKASGREMARVFGILLITMFMAGMIFNSTQTALPKVFAVRVDALLGEGALGVGLLVALVYGAAGVMQLVGGHMADRFPAKYVYVTAITLQVPLLYIAAGAGGFALVVVATLMVVANVGALPAENMLLAGLVFGLKFVLAFGAGPLAVQLVSLVQGRTGEFYWLFVALALFAACALAAALLLPSDRVEVAVSKAGA
jgi:FSR family fosmidomycin resistance protein-like MFS transporter